MATAESKHVEAPDPEPVPVALVRALVDVAQRVSAPLPVYTHLVEVLADGRYGEPGTDSPFAAVDPALERQFWENAAGEPSLRTLGIEGPRAAADGSFGALELAITSAATVLDSLVTLGTYSEVLHGVSIYAVAQRDDGSVVVLYESPHARDRPAAELAAEFALASVVELVRRRVGDPRLSPREVHLRGRPLELASLREALGCEIHVGAATDRVELGSEIASLPVRSSSPRLHALARRLCTLERAALFGGRTRAGVRWALRCAVTERAPLLDAVAERLQTRPRTMQARLTAEGVSFRALVDDARRRAVERLLVAGAGPREIQTELGYADAASLRRACRRWWGVGPTGRARALRVLTARR